MTLEQSMLGRDEVAHMPLNAYHDGTWAMKPQRNRYFSVELLDCGV